MGKQKLVIDSPCIVTVTADGDEVSVEIETTRKSQAEKLHDTLIGHNRLLTRNVTLLTLCAKKMSLRGISLMA